MIPLRSRIEEARHAGFIGRAEQREAFVALLEAPAPEANLVYVHGPAGIGKSTLLNEYAFCAREAGWDIFALDLRDAEPSVEALHAFIASRAPFTVDASGLRLAPDAPARFVLLLDTCESAGEAGERVMLHLLDVLPREGLVVAAGRGTGGTRLHTDTGWRALTRWQPLSVLEREEGRALLDARQVPSDQQESVLDFASGHPLALSLVADAFEQNPDYHFEPEAAPDVTAALLRRFVDQIPDRAHRHALYAIGLPPVTDEPLLASMLDTDDVYALFEWLRSRSFVENTARGVQPHELVRNVLAADLRWRNPDLFETLHRRAREHYAARLASPRAAHSRVLADYLFLFRDNPLVQPLLSRLRTQWAGRTLRESQPLSPADSDAVAALVALHEGEDAARWATYWMREQPQSVHVYHDDAGHLCGCLFALRLTPDGAAATEDPAVQAAYTYMAGHTPLRPGEAAVHFRFWMGRDHYQGLSPEQCLVFADTVRHYLTTPRLAWTFLPCAQPEMWDLVFRFVGLNRLHEAAYTSGDAEMAVYGLDWRVVPPAVWLETIAAQGLLATQHRKPPVEQTFNVLSEDAFAEAVKDVLQRYTQPQALLGNPLLGTRLLSAHTPAEAAMNALRNWITAHVDALEQSPRKVKMARALRATYLDPVGTQERAAEALDLPFSTYRRHLRAGLENVAEVLWKHEVAGTLL